MPSRWSDVRRRGKNGQTFDMVIRRCKTEKKELRSEELKNLEEEMPRLKASDLEKAARNYEATSGGGCDDFHPRMSLDLERETQERR